MSTHESSAMIEVAKVKRACRRCIRTINESRSKCKEKAIAWELGRRFFPAVDRADAIVRVNNGDLSARPWLYLSGLHYDAAERLLKLAKATHALEMRVSSTDWESVA